MDPKWYYVDWTQSDVEIARQMNRSRERIRQIRMELGLPPSRTRTRRSLASRVINPDETVAQNAKRLGVSVTTVRNFVRDAGLIVAVRWGRKPKYDWAAVNWHQPNVVIARQLCRNPTAGFRVAVAKQRRIRAPHTIGLYDVRKVIDWSVVNWRQSNDEIQRMMFGKVSPSGLSSVKYARKQFAPHTIGRHARGRKLESARDSWN